MIRVNCSLLIAVVFGAVVATLPLQSSSAPRQVAYTDGQAAMGSGVYAQYCIFCHGANLQGNAQANPPRPPLTGPKFAGDWSGKTAGDLLAFVSKNMPFGRGGTLSHDQYVAVLTYILSRNGLPANGKAFDDKALSGTRLNL